jgi:hypothetical protein
MLTVVCEKKTNNLLLMKFVETNKLLKPNLFGVAEVKNKYKLSVTRFIHLSSTT